MPRLLFPDKAEINDSERAVRFTGLKLSGSDEGTSIGIGYMAESYVDFGEFLMALPLLALGYLFGCIYRAFGSVRMAGFWGVALAVASIFPSMKGIEISAPKLVGGVITTFIVLYTINSFLGAKISRWLRGGSKVRQIV